MPEVHSKLGASNAHRWMECPGSVALEAQYPNTSSPASRLGTAAHSLAEMCLNNGKDALDYLGGNIEVEGEQIAVDEQMVQGVQLYLDTIRVDIHFYKSIGALVDMNVERMFQLDHIHEDLFGTNDCSLVITNMELYHIIVYDYKNGRQSVDVKNNPQLLYYAQGAIRGIPFEKLYSIELVIVQPNAEGQKVKRCTVFPGAMKEFADILKIKADEALKPNAPTIPGDHCHWCRAQGGCPAKMQLALSAFPKSQLPEPTAEPPGFSLPKPEALSINDRTKAIRIFASSTFKEWVDALMALERHQLELGIKVPGRRIEVSTKLGNRKWVEDEQRIYDALHPVLDSEMFNNELKTPAQMEKALKTIGYTAAKAKDAIAALCERPSKEVTVVTDDIPEITE